MGVILRNRVTTEFKTVEADSEEFYSLRAEVAGDGRPVWEQTSAADKFAYDQRVATGQLRPEDIGDADQPVATITANDLPTFGFGGMSTLPIEDEQGLEPAHQRDPSEATLGSATTAQMDVRVNEINQGRGASTSAEPITGDYESYSKEQLAAEASRRGVDVMRSDGGSGSPLKDDYVEALEANDEEQD